MRGLLLANSRGWARRLHLHQFPTLHPQRPMKPKSNPFLLPSLAVTLTLSAVFSQSASAATYYWDSRAPMQVGLINQEGFGQAGGVWTDPTAAHWTTDPTGDAYLWGSLDRKSTRLNSSHGGISRMPSSA